MNVDRIYTGWDGGKGGFHCYVEGPVYNDGKNVVRAGIQGGGPYNNPSITGGSIIYGRKF